MSIFSSVAASNAEELAKKALIEVGRGVGSGLYSKDALIGARLMYKLLDEYGVFDE